MIGLLIGGIWLAFDLVPTRGGRRALTLGFVVLLAASAVTAYFQVRIWHDSIALWEHTLAVTQGNFVAHADLAAAYGEADRTDEALEQVQRASEVCPDSPRAILHLARLWYQYRRLEAAVLCVEEALPRYPDELPFYDFLAMVLRKQGNEESALRWENEAEQRRRAQRPAAHCAVEWWT